MNVQEVRDHVRIQEWVELIKERSASGMTIRDWCESKGLSENQYYYWLRKIRKTACTALESRSDLTPQIKGEPPAFAQINVMPDACPTGSDTGISIHLKHADIHIGSDVGRRQLETVMKEVLHAE